MFFKRSLNVFIYHPLIYPLNYSVITINNSITHNYASIHFIVSNSRSTIDCCKLGLGENYSLIHHQ